MAGIKGAMESQRPRVSISAAGEYVYGGTLSRSSSAGAIPIRAPLTIDDGDQDDEDDSSGSELDVRNSASSDASSYSGEIDSGTDEGFESASADPDDDTAEEDPGFGGIRVYRPFKEDPGAETGEGSVFSGRSGVYRPFVGDRNHEISVNDSSFGEEESGSSNEVDGVSESEIASETGGVRLNARVVIPRARLSLDDDEVDEILSSEDEDNASLRVVKVPGYSGEKVGETGVIDKPNGSGSVTGEFISAEEEMMGMNYSDNGSVSFETIEEKSVGFAPEDSDESVGVAPGDSELLVESAEDSDEAGKRIDETSNQRIEQVAIQGSIVKETGHITESGTCEADTLMIAVEGSIASGSGEPGGEYAGNKEGEEKDCWENDCGLVGGLGRPEYGAESEFRTQNSESFGLSATQCSLTMANHEAVGEVDVSASDSGSTNPKVKPESEKEGKQDSEEIERKLSPLDESVSGLKSGSSIEMAAETADNGEQISPQINKVALESDSEAYQTSAKVEDSSLFSDKDVEIITSGNCSVITDEETENGTEMEQLIHDQAYMEFGELVETNDRREKPLHSTLLNVSEESYPEHFTWQIREEKKEGIENVQLLKTKLLGIIRRLGLSADDSVVTEVLSKLTLALGELQTSQGFYPESDVMKKMQLEEEDPDDPDFSINILVLGKTGVGKSATINSVFGETKCPVGAFGHTTKSAKYIVGNVGGVRVRVLDTPGLRSSATEERVNRKVLLSIKKRMRTFPVDIVLYIDRVDEYSGNPSDIQLLGTITSCLGPSIWKNAIIVLTHAASTVLDSSSYKEIVTQRIFLLCQSIRKAVPELSSADDSVMPRVVLADNKEKLFPENKASESKSQIWRSQLLLLCCSAKIMSETSSLQKNETMIEKSNLSASPLQSFTLFCSMWNMLLHGAHPRQVSRLHEDLEGKIGHLLDSRSETPWDEQSKGSLEQQIFHVNKQLGDEGKRLENEEINKGCEERSALGRIKTRRRRLGLQEKPGLEGFGVYIITSGLKTGFIAGCDRGSTTFSTVRTNDEREARILIRMRGSMAVLGVVPLLMTMFSCVYGRK